MDAHQLIMLITVFVLAVFLGFELISRVPPTLHTPCPEVTLFLELPLWGQC